MVFCKFYEATLLEICRPWLPNRKTWLMLSKSNSIEIFRSEIRDKNFLSDSVDIILFKIRSHLKFAREYFILEVLGFKLSSASVKLNFTLSLVKPNRWLIKVHRFSNIFLVIARFHIISHQNRLMLHFIIARHNFDLLKSQLISNCILISTFSVWKSPF